MKRKEKNSSKKHLKRDKDTLESQLETSAIVSDSDEETISDDDNKDRRFGHAFTKDKTSGNVNNSLASMLNKACSSPAMLPSLRTSGINTIGQTTSHIF